MMDEYAQSAQYYDHVGLYASRPDVRFWIEEAKASGGPVLELGSGTGRVLIPIAREGIAITGLDMSEAMLEACREKLQQESEDVRERVTLTRGDMQSFQAGEGFALVTMPFRPFQHLIEVSEQLACLESVRRALKPGGRLAFDLFNPSIPMLNKPLDEVFMVEEPFTMPDCRRVVRKHRFVDRDLFHQVNTIDMIHAITWPDGREEEDVWRFTMRWFYRYEIEHLVERAGFTLENVYADYDRSPYGSKYPGELIVVARKR